jgi:hypothetical protein
MFLDIDEKHTLPLATYKDLSQEIRSDSIIFNDFK